MSSPKVTIPSLRKVSAGGRPLTMSTAYDFPTAKIADAAGVDLILVGDSVGMVVLGYDSTLPVTMDEMIHHVKAARRGTKRALLVADMPFLSFGVAVSESVRNAGRFVKEAGAEAVKLEGGDRVVREIEAITTAQIPVMAHLGLTPQSIHTMGGFSVQAKTAELAEDLVRQAKAVQDAGAFSVVLEGIPREVAAYVSSSIAIPTIGIGAGPDCDGQVLVYHDIMGLHDGHYAKFVRTYLDGHRLHLEAMKAFVRDVHDGAFPSDAESYHLRTKEAERLTLYSGDGTTC